MKGVILAGGSGTRLRPLTSVVSKQLLPIYDKPMIYYPLSTLIHAGVNDCLIISTPIDTPRIQDLLGEGDHLGMKISYLVQDKPEGIAQGVSLASDFTKKEKFWFILGDNLFHGPSFGAKLKNIADSESIGAHIFAYRVMDPREYGVVTIDESTEEVLGFIEKPLTNHPGWAVPGLYLLDSKSEEYFKKLSPSSRGEYEILDLLNEYRKNHSLRMTRISRGDAWFDLGSIENLHIGSQFVHAIQSRQGQLIGSPEEAALRAGLIQKDHFLQYLEKQSKSTYFEYLRNHYL
jgi:glucose-1-phosphate thymidylyltransferase